MQSFQLHPLSSLSSLHIRSRRNQTSGAEDMNSNVKLGTSFEGEDFFSSISTSLHVSIDNRDKKLGCCIHSKIMKSGFDSSIYIGNSLLNMYAKCGQFEDAVKLFEEMPNRTVVSWTSIISGYCQNNLPDEAISLFLQMLGDLQPNEFTLSVMLQACVLKCDQELVQEIHSYIIKYGFTSDNFLINSLVDAYADAGKLGDAEKLVETLFSRDVVSWTSVISGCVRNGMEDRALLLFFRMQEDGIMPNEVTILSILQACSIINNWELFLWIQGIVMKTEWCTNSLVVNSLVEMYSTNGYILEGGKIFCNLCFFGEGLYISPETMANLLHGCGSSGLLKLGEEIHGYLIKHGFIPCTVIENSLLDMYGDMGCIDSAFQLFSRVRSKDIISWNSMLTCLVKHERSREALDLLREIHINVYRDGIFPDFVTMLMSIQACSNLVSLHLGQIIHGYLTRTGLVCDTYVRNSLIDLYAKSGKVEFCRQIFDEMTHKDLGSWNSMIAAYGLNGKGTSALKIYARLKDSRTYQPNEITFVNILSACAHSGLVKEGFEIFNHMDIDNAVEPNMEHYACMVDLLGRSGKLEEAQDFIDKMPLKAAPDVWGALLGACGLFGNVEIAERAGKALSVLEPKGKVWRVTLSNIYANAGRWEDVGKLRVEMRRSEELRKEGGWSSVEVRGDLFNFMVGDKRHPRSTLIYKVLNELHENMRSAEMLVVGVF